MRASRRWALAAAAVVATCASATPASAATIIGARGTEPANPLGADTTYVQTTDDPGRPSFAAPSAGVITSWRARLGSMGTLPSIFTLKVVRPAAAGQFTVVGESAGSFTGFLSSLLDASFPARVPVAAGDRIGLAVPSGAVAASFASGITGAVLGSVSGNATGTFALSPTPDVRIQLEATLEPTTDLAIAMSASPARLAVGDVTTVVISASASSGPAPATTATITMPRSLSVVAASTTGGECTGSQPLTCSFGDLPLDATRRAFLVLRPTAAGAPTISATVQSASPDSAPSNNSASTTLMVTGAVGSTTTIALCRVPSLRGLGLPVARKRLTTAGCRLGTVHRSGARKGHIRAQSIPAGIRVAAGTRVSVVLGRASR